MADKFFIGGASEAPEVGNLKLGSVNIDKIYQGEDLVWPIVSNLEDPFTPTNGTARFIAANNVGEVILYDTSFNEVTPSVTISDLPNSYYDLIGVSDTMEYMAACAVDSSGNQRGSVVISQDYGANWNTPTSGALYADYYSCEASKSGRVIVVGSKDGVVGTDNGRVYLSSNYGGTFGAITFPGLTGHSIVFVYGLGMSYDGKMIGISIRTKTGSTYNNYSFYSTDYGANWTNIVDEGATNGHRYCNIAVSGGGKYFSFVNYNSLNNSWYSSDYGQSWTSIDWSYIGNFTTLVGNLGIRMSHSGQYHLMTDTGSDKLWYGDNYMGSSATPSSLVTNSTQDPKNTRISNDGSKLFLSDDGNSSPDYWYSDDYGQTWTSGNAPSTVSQGPIIMLEV
jgi:hypothetical protein